MQKFFKEELLDCLQLAQTCLEQKKQLTENDCRLVRFLQAVYYGEVDLPSPSIPENVWKGIHGEEC